MAVQQETVPVPPQMPIHATYDFRNSSTAPKGYKDTRKRKLDDYAEQVWALPSCSACRPEHASSAISNAKRSAR